MDNIYKYVLEKDLIRPMKNGTIYRFDRRKKKYIEAKQFSTGRKGEYRTVTIGLNGKQYHLYVHRLIAFMYIPNPDNKPTVNHIDGDPSNNNIKNLEWATYSEQTVHAYETGLLDVMINATECSCGKLTRAEDGICSECKYNLELERKRKTRVEQTRRELGLIDLRALSFREKEIVYRRYIGRTYEEIGEEFGFSKQRAEQIINAAKLRVFIEPTYPNLERYLIENEVDVQELSYWCNLTPRTIENRLRGRTDWKLDEAIAIKEKLKIEEELERLFFRNREA